MEDSHRERDNLNRNASGRHRNNKYYKYGVVVFFVFSAAFFCATMGFGWAFIQNVVPADQYGAALVAAIISIIPVIIAVFVYFCYYDLIKRLREGEPVNRCSFKCFICIELLAAFIEVIGGIIFLVVTIKANSHPGYNPTLGFLAAIFGLLTGFTFCCGLCCWYYQSSSKR